MRGAGKFSAAEKATSGNSACWFVAGSSEKTRAVRLALIKR